MLSNVQSPKTTQIAFNIVGHDININNGIKEPTHGYHNCDTNHILIFGGYVKERESLCMHVQVIIRANAILNYIDARVTWPRYEGSYMVYRPKLH